MQQRDQPAPQTSNKTNRNRRRNSQPKHGSPHSGGDSSRSFAAIVGSPERPPNRCLMGVASSGWKVEELFGLLPHVERHLVREVYKNFDHDAARTVDYFMPHLDDSKTAQKATIAVIPNMDPFIDLPNALALQIFEFLHNMELGRFKRISRECNRLATDCFLDKRKADFSKKYRFWTDFRILTMISAFPKLDYLNLSNCMAFESFFLLPSFIRDVTLKRLCLSNCAMLEDDDVSTLVSQFPCLELLDLSKTEISDLALDYLSSGCFNLKELRLQECQEITASGLQYFMKRCKTLERLNLNRTTLQPNDLEFVSENNLFRLEMRFCRFARARFDAEFCSLQVLNLSFSSCLFTVDVNLPYLQVLNLSSSKSLRVLSLQAPHLQTLNLHQCISLREIRNPDCPKLTVLKMFMCRSLESESLGNLIASCGETLTSFNAEGMIYLRDRDVMFILGHCTVLKSFRVEGCKLPDFSLREITNALNRIQL